MMKKINCSKIMKVSHLMAIIFIAMIAVSCVGCKDKKVIPPVVNQETIKQEKLKNAKASLEALLNDNTLSLEEREKKLNEIKGLNFSNEELGGLVSKIEDKIKLEKEAVVKLEEEKKLKAAEELKKTENIDLKTKLNRAFEEIIALGIAGNSDKANLKINETMQLFASDAADVLIILTKQGTDIDYDEPTNIKKYLNYLKDKKENKNVIENLVMDANGKIKEMELIKKK